MDYKPEIIGPQQFLDLSSRLPVIDVRSPGEFLQGHISGAINIPLFDNEERARIGTTYVQIGKEEAVQLGQHYAGFKTDFYLKQVSAVEIDKSILLHCWRGGMRSAKIALFYAEHGFKVFILDGGYKAYRQFIRKQFADGRSLIVVGGYTGSGKTDVLKKLNHKGYQVVDLEDLACHKGSVFGHLGQQSQPTTEQFENNLFTWWNSADSLKPTWVEHESKNIGNVFLPDTFHLAMLQGVLFQLIVPVKQRIRRLVEEYACFEDDMLLNVLNHLAIRMGSYQVAEARKALLAQDYEKVGEITLKYYDKLYDNSMKKRPVKRIVSIDMSCIALQDYVEVLLKKAQEEHLL